MRWWRAIWGLALASVVPAVVEAHGGGADGVDAWIDEVLLLGIAGGALLLIGVILLTGRRDGKVDEKLENEEER